MAIMKFLRISGRLLYASLNIGSVFTTQQFLEVLATGEKNCSQMKEINRLPSRPIIQGTGIIC